MDEQRRIRVAVVFGGRSSEHAISCISAGSVLSAIDRNAYDVVPIGITPEGRWVVERDEPERLRITDGRLPAVDASGSHVVLPGDPTHGGIDVRPADAAVGLLHDVDVVFPVLHGPWGEDGTIQGLLELAGIPYVGSGVFASAAAMDKGHMKAVLLAAGLEVGPYELVTASQWRTDPNAVLDRLVPLGMPVFVKPARAGSSVGITRVTDPADLPPPVEDDVRAQAVAAFEALTCEGLARVDFFVTAEGRAIVNEVNTMPGFTSISMFPRMWQASGMSYPDLGDHLLADALRRGTGLR
jgi:D-alanine-D-alanine ligase